jgi:hypothetical protein
MGTNTYARDRDGNPRHGRLVHYAGCDPRNRHGSGMVTGCEWSDGVESCVSHASGSSIDG